MSFPTFVNFITPNAVRRTVSTGASSNIPSQNDIAALIASHNVSAISAAILAKSSSLRNSPILLPTIFQSVLEIASFIAVNIPCAHKLRVCASAPKSNVLKKLLIPLAIDSPKSFQSNVLPNEFKAYKAVFSEAAIVFPTSPNNSGLINPLRKLANPLPKFLAP